MSKIVLQYLLQLFSYSKSNIEKHNNTLEGKSNMVVRDMLIHKPSPPAIYEIVLLQVVSALKAS